MYKVVIIDDEDMIVRGLCQVIDWSSYGCEVVATGHDARAGAALIREHKPDILFTDIKMPGEDGLSMLAGLKGEFPSMQITILTGYRDFDYAQRAISLGVNRFLLKPSKMDELKEALENMTANLAAQRERRRLLEASRQILSEEAPAASDAGAAAVSARAAAAEAAAEEDSPANNFILRQALKYIAAHCCEKISLQDVADHCYVSSWHLSKLLNSQPGRNFYDLLNKERVDKAKELLFDPSLRISDVALAVGYADVGHFSRVFKKICGKSPGDWRNAQTKTGGD